MMLDDVGMVWSPCPTKSRSRKRGKERLPQFDWSRRKGQGFESQSEGSHQLSAIIGEGITRCGHIKRMDKDTAR